MATGSVPREGNVAVNGDGVAQHRPTAMIRPQLTFLLTPMQESVDLVMVLLEMKLVRARMSAVVRGVIAELAISIAQ